jgi:hypothetical protein
MIESVQKRRLENESAVRGESDLPASSGDRITATYCPVDSIHVTVSIISTCVPFLNRSVCCQFQPSAPSQLRLQLHILMVTEYCDLSMKCWISYYILNQAFS